MITEYLRGEFEARLVTVFAEDRRSTDEVFFSYYVFEEGQPPIPDRAGSCARQRIPGFHLLLGRIARSELAPNQDRFDRPPWATRIRVGWLCTTIGPMFTCCARTSRIRYCPRLKENATSTGQLWEKVSFRVPVGPVQAAPPERRPFQFLPWPVSRYSTCSFECSTPIRGRKKLFERLPIHKAVFLAESISGDRVFLMARLSASRRTSGSD